MAQGSDREGGGHAIPLWAELGRADTEQDPGEGNGKEQVTCTEPGVWTVC